MHAANLQSHDDSADRLDEPEAYIPDGFTLVQEIDGALFLVCTDELAPTYAVRVIGRGAQAIARRVPADATEAIVAAPRGAVIWQLGITGADREDYRIVVHRPFGAIVVF